MTVRISVKNEHTHDKPEVWLAVEDESPIPGAANLKVREKRIFCGQSETEYLHGTRSVRVYEKS